MFNLTFLIHLGAPARCTSPSRFGLEKLELFVETRLIASLRVSLCRSLCPKAPAFAVFPLQSLAQIFFSDKARN